MSGQDKKDGCVEKILIYYYDDIVIFFLFFQYVLEKKNLVKISLDQACRLPSSAPRLPPPPRTQAIASPRASPAHRIRALPQMPERRSRRARPNPILRARTLRSDRRPRIVPPHAHAARRSLVVLEPTRRRPRSRLDSRDDHARARATSCPAPPTLRFGPARPLRAHPFGLSSPTHAQPARTHTTHIGLSASF